jgi:hypothetical protein
MFSCVLVRCVWRVVIKLPCSFVESSNFVFWLRLCIFVISERWTGLIFFLAEVGDLLPFRFYSGGECFVSVYCVGFIFGVFFTCMVKRFV